MFCYYKEDIQKLKKAIIDQDKKAFKEAGMDIELYFAAKRHYRTCRLAFRKGGAALLERKLYNIIKDYKFKSTADLKREMRLIQAGCRDDI